MDIILSFGIRFPAVTAYLLLGVLIGPAVFNLVSSRVLQSSGVISNVVLSIIAFSLGQNFSKENFSKIGKSVICISVLEAAGAWICVTFAFFLLLKRPFYQSLLFGSIASATAPAATVMVIREYKARGTFTDTLLGVVAIDDAWCLIIFAVSLSIAKALIKPLTSNLFLITAFGHALLEIGGAFVLGAALILSYFSRYVTTEGDLLIYTLGFILLTTGIALYFHLSVLLSNIFLGMTLVNINRTSFKFFDILRSVDSPLYLCFFVLAGANLEIGLLGKLGLMGITYLLFRIVGKLTGASLGGYLSKAATPVRKYLGFGLWEWP